MDIERRGGRRGEGVEGGLRGGDGEVGVRRGKVRSEGREETDSSRRGRSSSSLLRRRSGSREADDADGRTGEGEDKGTK